MERFTSFASFTKLALYAHSSYTPHSRYSLNLLPFSVPAPATTIVSPVIHFTWHLLATRRCLSLSFSSLLPSSPSVPVTAGRHRCAPDQRRRCQENALSEATGTERNSTRRIPGEFSSYSPSAATRRDFCKYASCPLANRSRDTFSPLDDPLLVSLIKHRSIYIEYPMKVELRGILSVSTSKRTEIKRTRVQGSRDPRRLIVFWRRRRSEFREYQDGRRDCCKAGRWAQRVGNYGRASISSGGGVRFHGHGHVKRARNRRSLGRFLNDTDNIQYRTYRWYRG